MAKPKKDFNDEALLKKLKAARDADPNWEKAREAFIKAEVEFGKDDPCEGVPFVETKFTRPKRSK